MACVFVIYIRRFERLVTNNLNNHYITLNGRAIIDTAIEISQVPNNSPSDYRELSRNSLVLIIAFSISLLSCSVIHGAVMC